RFLFASAGLCAMLWVLRITHPMPFRLFQNITSVAVLTAVFFSFAPVQAADPAAYVPVRDILIKARVKGTPVYYLASDGKRYVFPNEKTYSTWFTDFSDVRVKTPSEMSQYPIGGNV